MAEWRIWAVRLRKTAEDLRCFILNDQKACLAEGPGTPRNTFAQTMDMFSARSSPKAGARHLRKPWVSGAYGRNAMTYTISSNIQTLAQGAAAEVL